MYSPVLFNATLSWFDLKKTSSITGFTTSWRREDIRVTQKVAAVAMLLNEISSKH